MKNKLAVYEKALELYIADPDPIFIGLCYLLSSAILILEEKFIYGEGFIMASEEEVWDYVHECLFMEDNTDMLEISKHRPENPEMYWFPTETKDKRISILEEAIKTVKDEQKIN